MNDVRGAAVRRLDRLAAERPLLAEVLDLTFAVLILAGTARLMRVLW
jgi:hypothetical protein